MASVFRVPWSVNTFWLAGSAVETVMRRVPVTSPSELPVELNVPVSLVVETKHKGAGSNVKFVMFTAVPLPCVRVSWKLKAVDPSGFFRRANQPPLMFSGWCKLPHALSSKLRHITIANLIRLTRCAPKLWLQCFMVIDLFPPVVTRAVHLLAAGGRVNECKGDVTTACARQEAIESFIACLLSQ
jgi:hypothetical protein